MLLKHKTQGNRLFAYNRDKSFIFHGPLCGFMPAGEGARYSHANVYVTTPEEGKGDTITAFEFLGEATEEEFEKS